MSYALRKAGTGCSGAPKQPVPRALVCGGRIVAAQVHPEGVKGELVLLYGVLALAVQVRLGGGGNWCCSGML